jgi:hypothetical protein
LTAEDSGSNLHQKGVTASAVTGSWVVGPPSSKSSNVLLEGLMSDPSEKPNSGTGCLLRIYWMAVGYVIAAFLVILIAEQKDDFYTFKDILYWLAVASIILARYLDVQFMDGQTAEGAPATMKNWERHSTVLGAAAVLVWIACHMFLSTRG